MVTKSVKQQCQSLFGDNHNVLKLVFMIFSSILFIEELHTFFVVKPTLTYSAKRKLTPQDFPEILLCPAPSVDLDVLSSIGYYGIESYKFGQNWTFLDEDIGWIGNYSEPVQKVSDDVSVLNSTDDCPYAFIWYDSENPEPTRDDEYENVNFTFTTAMYPNHICCKVVTPAVADTRTILGIQIGFDFENKSFAAFKLSLSDRLTASVFDQHKTKMFGADMNSLQYPGFFNYKVKVMEDVHLENDPNYPCIDYKNHHEYHTCLGRASTNFIHIKVFHIFTRQFQLSIKLFIWLKNQKLVIKSFC